MPSEIQSYLTQFPNNARTKDIHKRAEQMAGFVRNGGKVELFTSDAIPEKATSGLMDYLSDNAVMSRLVVFYTGFALAELPKEIRLGADQESVNKRNKIRQKLLLTIGINVICSLTLYNN